MSNFRKLANLHFQRGKNCDFYDFSNIRLPLVPKHCVILCLLVFAQAVPLSGS